MRVEIIETQDLGDRSYVVHDGTVAVVVDPQRDLDRVRADHADAYAAFHARFNACMDGTSARRVVEAFFGDGA